MKLNKYDEESKLKTNLLLPVNPVEGLIVFQRKCFIFMNEVKQRMIFS
jgi:hypothetical protein